MADDTIEIEALTKTVKGLVEAQREAHESLVKKVDTVTADKLGKIEKDLEGACQQLSDIATAHKKSLEDQKKLEDELGKAGTRCDELELLIAARGSQKSGKAHRSELDVNVAEYLRQGVKNGLIGTVPYELFAKDVADDILSKCALTKDSDLLHLARKDLVIGVNPDGGFFVTPQFGGIIEGQIFETSPIRNLATIVTTTSDTFEYVLDDDEADCKWVGEVDPRPKTDTAQIGKIIIPIHELEANPRATQKMLDDAGFDIAAWHQRKVADAFSRKENSAFVIGDGSKKPEGFLSIGESADPNLYERGKIGTLETSGAGVIDGDDLKSIKGLLKEDYQGNAVWGMKRATWTTITKLKDSQNRYLFDLISNLRDGDIMQLLGQSVVLMNDMPDIGTGAFSVVYADFRRAYTIVDRFGIRVLRDPFSSKPFVEFYTTKRVGAAVTNFDSIKRLKIK